MTTIIWEAEGVDLEVCDGNDYLLYGPSYPWRRTGPRQFPTEGAANEMFQKYISILTDEDIDISYQAVENGG